MHPMQDSLSGRSRHVRWSSKSRTRPALSAAAPRTDSCTIRLHHYGLGRPELELGLGDRDCARRGDEGPGCALNARGPQGLPLHCLRGAGRPGGGEDGARAQVPARTQPWLRRQRLGGTEHATSGSMPRPADSPALPEPSLPLTRSRLALEQWRRWPRASSRATAARSGCATRFGRGSPRHQTSRLGLTRSTSSSPPRSRPLTSLRRGCKMR